ncbi:MAG: hypothetical protein R2800_14155 [Flavipsychrobacter sp.]
MKYIKLSVLLVSLLFINSAFAQEYKHQINCSPVTQNFQGWSVDVQYKFIRPKSVLYFGPSILINPPHKARNYNAVFKNKAYASSLLQHIMLKAGYEYSIKFKENGVRLFPFAELHFARTDLKYEYYQGMIAPETYDNDTSISIVEYNLVDPIMKNVLFLNVNLGVGIEIPLANRISLQERVALTQNTAYFDDNINGTQSFFFSFGFFHSLGLNYSFK